MLTWHPRAPRPDGKYKENEIWEETRKWDPPNIEHILWFASPDKKQKEPIDYSIVMDPKVFEEKIREILKKHEVRFIEPKE